MHEVLQSPCGDKLKPAYVELNDKGSEVTVPLRG